MPEGNKVRIHVGAASSTDVGNFIVPPMRHRVSDAIVDGSRLFVNNMTNVAVHDRDRSSSVSLHKNLVKSIAQLWRSPLRVGFFRSVAE